MTVPLQIRPRRTAAILPSGQYENLCRAASFGSRLAGLLLQPLAGDANALLLVRIGRTQRAKIRGHLADLRLVRAADDDVRLLIDGNLNSLGNRKLDGVGLAESEGDDFALKLGAIADADDVEIFLEALGDAMNGVGQERAGEAMERAMFFIIADAR